MHFWRLACFPYVCQPLQTAEQAAGTEHQNKSVGELAPEDSKTLLGEIKRKPWLSLNHLSCWDIITTEICEGPVIIGGVINCEDYIMPLFIYLFITNFSYVCWLLFPLPFHSSSSPLFFLLLFSLSPPLLPLFFSFLFFSLSPHLFLLFFSPPPPPLLLPFFFPPVYFSS